MNPKTGVQIIAAFMILSMILSSVAYFIGSDGSDNQNEQAGNFQNTQDDYFDVGGMQVLSGFASITDGLKMSTPDTYAAQFIDVEYIASTEFSPWNEQLPVNLTTVQVRNKGEVDGLYMTSTEQIYFAQLLDGEFLLMSTMTPKRVNFDYVGLPSSNGQYLLLIRSDTGGTNVMGEPTIYTSSHERAEDVLTIIESFAAPATAYDTFSPVLNYSDDYSEYQVVNSRVEFADLYYLGIYRNDDGNFTRTTIYYNPADETVEHVNEMAGDGVERGFTRYDVTTADGEILKVVIAGEFPRIISEDIK